MMSTSPQDGYVPFQSTRIEACLTTSALRTTAMKRPISWQMDAAAMQRDPKRGRIHEEMMHNVLRPIDEAKTKVVRCSAHGTKD
jgi:hypothetical protein